MFVEENYKEIKDIILKSIRNYLDKKRREGINYHVIQEIFPVERRIRAIIGGLETSFGERVWEPLARILAENNGFLVHDVLDFKRPKNLPKEIEKIINDWKKKRINSKEDISLEEYINELRNAVKSLNIDYSKVEYVKLIKGQGIDLWIEKDNIEYITDIKTTQINAADGNKFNDHILNWYAYRIFQNPDVQIKAFITIPFNPFNVPWERKMKGRAKPLIIGDDIIIAEKFWRFVSGDNYSYEKIIKAFKELKNEGLLEEYRDVIYGENFETKHKVLELFSGAGGLSLGLEEAGFEHVGLIEIDKHACNTLRKNRPNWNVIEEDVVKVAEKGIYQYIDKDIEVDVLAGGYPAQPFSYAGNKARLDDVREILFYYYAEILSQLKPKMFLVENVKGLVTHDGGKTLKIMIEVFENIGYKVQWEILNALDFGVAQKRERIVIIGIRNDLVDKSEFKFPKPFEYKPTLRDALKNVPKSEGQQYSEKKRKVLDLVPSGGCWVDLPEEIAKEFMGKSYYSGGGKRGMARRISWDEPCLTLTCNPSQRQTERCHPDETRPFTTREYARIQSFPDEWMFEGSIGEIYKQIGNAFPVNFGKAVGMCIKRFLDEIE
ncbi:TdeIII family type II restriction endonuclease [Clostridium botulinum]|nr:TdeIII family type II restriction endonuclease [Clostridium botulinum]NFR13982.1 TdeIII family type II restriction endonuclease [Clostridium botulinum]NFR44458.1 TdeIII family type II restriction endonuclease [Clostridium botulinum]